MQKALLIKMAKVMQWSECA